MNKTEQLRELIRVFLGLNPEPADAQFHALAAAAGVDKETLESIAYEMLAEAEGQAQPQTQQAEVLEVQDEELEEPTEVEGAETSVQQDVLDGDYDPATTSADDLALNDGEPTEDNPDPGFTQETNVDGVGVGDSGIDLADKQDTYNDGVPSLDASTRLAASSNWSDE